MNAFSLEFVNQTPDTWVLSLYVENPDQDLISVSWMNSNVPPNGHIKMSWTDELFACLCSEEDEIENEIFSIGQKFETDIGDFWQCVVKDDVVQLAEGTPTGFENVTIQNVSGKEVNPGLAIGESLALVRKQMYSGLQVAFEFPYVIKAALFYSLKPGEVIMGQEATNVITIDYLKFNSFSLQAKIEGETMVFVLVDES